MPSIASDLPFIVDTMYVSMYEERIYKDSE